MIDNPLPRNREESGSVGNLIGKRSNAAMAVLSDESVNPFPVISKEYQILGTLDDQTIDFDDFCPA